MRQLGAGQTGRSAAKAGRCRVTVPAPRQGTAAQYHALMQRDDVMVLVEYYADW